MKVMSNFMFPVLKEGDIVVIKKIKNFQKTLLKRGEIIIFKIPDKEGRKLGCLRLVGFGGEEIAIKNGKLFINGKKVTTPAIFSQITYISDGILKVLRI